jgi:hypothetical protein
VTKVGGISEERRIAWTALDNGVAFVPHGWNTALGLAADLQLASAIPGTEFVEYLTGSPYSDSSLAELWRLVASGMLPSRQARSESPRHGSSRALRAGSGCPSRAETSAPRWRPRLCHPAPQRQVTERVVCGREFR